MPSGILLLDKPHGLSSNAALQRVRRLLGGVKAGHAGSLDPLATGMLPICIGEATKIVGDIVAGAKRYRFTVTLGRRTASGDAEGEVTATVAVPALTRAAVEAVLRGFLGPQTQVPPMHSAIKQGGAPLYRLARAGRTVERAPRTIEIHALELLDLAGESLELEARCSKGTYIRVLAEDIAERLGTVGFVSALRRLSVEPFGDEPMRTLESLEEECRRGGHPSLLPADLPLQHLAKVALPEASVARLLKGQAVAGGPQTPAVTADGATRVRLYDAAGRFLGLGTADGSGRVRPKRLLNPD
ncbi:MAG: tRNA pseudouridine(55) synthase TruB [Steroidobacteraceae bacterium]